MRTPPRRRPARLGSVRRCTSRAGCRAAWRGSAPWRPSACSRAACPPRASRGGLVATAPPARRAHESLRCHLDQRAHWAAAPLRTRSECGQRAELRVPRGHTNKTTVQGDQGLRESAIDKIPCTHISGSSEPPRRLVCTQCYGTAKRFCKCIKKSLPSATLSARMSYEKVPAVNWPVI